MQVILIIGITLILSVGMIFICSFLSGKSKNFMNKLSGKDKITKKQD